MRLRGLIRSIVFAFPVWYCHRNAHLKLEFPPVIIKPIVFCSFWTVFVTALQISITNSRCVLFCFLFFVFCFFSSLFKASLPAEATFQDIRRAEGKAGLPSIPLYCFSLLPLTWYTCFIDRNMPNRLSPIFLTIIVQLIFGLLTKTVISTTYVFKFAGMATNFKFTRQCWVQFQNL